MSRSTRERRLEAEELWPNLRQFLRRYFHPNWVIEFATVEAALDQAIPDCPLERREAIIGEWRDWNARKGWSSTLHLKLGHSLGVDIPFDQDVTARRFMNRIYDRLVESVRAEQARA
jgi:hypothetical protein